MSNTKKTLKIQSKETPKKTRGVRLTSDVDRRLIRLCNHLGTNPNSYLINEIGKAISRDEVALQIKDTHMDQQAMLSKITNFLPNLEKTKQN